ncbi:Uncharacterised protein [Actinomyces denticolens]|nr:Uncharacterised protein [Actinomyces denticolens]
MSLVEPISITGSPPLLQMLLDRLRTARLGTPITTMSTIMMRALGVALVAGVRISTIMMRTVRPIMGVSAVVMRGALDITLMGPVAMRAIRPIAGIGALTMTGIGVALVAGVRIGLPIMMGAAVTLMGTSGPITASALRPGIGVTLATGISISPTMTSLRIGSTMTGIGLPIMMGVAPITLVGPVVMRAIRPIAGTSRLALVASISLATGTIGPIVGTSRLAVVAGISISTIVMRGAVDVTTVVAGIGLPIMVGVAPVTLMGPVVMRAIRPIAGTPRITAAAGISSIRTGTVLTTDTSTIRRTGTTITDAPTGRALSGMRTLRRRSISRARRRPQTRPRLRNIDVLTLRRTCAHLGHIHAGRINHPTIRDIHIHTRHIDPGRRVSASPLPDDIIEIEIQVQRRLDLPGNIAGWDLDQLPDPSTHRIQERQNTINRDRDLPGTSQPRTRRPELPSLTRPSSSTNKQSPNVEDSTSCCARRVVTPLIRADKALHSPTPRAPGRAQTSSETMPAIIAILVLG